MPGLFSMSGVALTLSQFTTSVGNAIRMSPALQGVWVTAELSDVRVNGGHCYMELIEKNQTGQTVAKLRATIWQSRFQYIRSKFIASTGHEIMTGMKVLLNGSASYHTLYGLSFSVNDIDPSYTLGDMERLRREILMRLQQEGVIGLNKSLAMPFAPQRIAVISAEGAAGYGDFMNHLVGNQEGFVFYPVLVPAVMQGERTSVSVREALNFIAGNIHMWDCVAIIRGGGATTDLNGFDDYKLARAVATFPLPIVVGIGHERDRTVLDEIAHTRMKTPTAVAGFFIDSLRAFYNKTADLVNWIAHYSMERLSGEARRLANCEAMVPALAEARLVAAKARLDKEMTRLPVLVSSRLRQGMSRLDNFGVLLKTLVSRQSARSHERLGDIVTRMSLAAQVALKRNGARIEALSGMVDVLNPDNTLRRGYSITRMDGKAVTDVHKLPCGARITTKLYNGEVSSVVE